MKYYIIILTLIFSSCTKQRSVGPLNFKGQKTTLATYLNEQETKQFCLHLIQSFEHFNEFAYWDVNNWRGGWGTTCKKGETFTIEKANRLCLQAYERRISNIKRSYPHLDMWQTHVLAAFHYNVQNFGDNLKKAIYSGDNEQIAEMMLLYYNPGTIYADGLLARRELEVTILFTNGERSKLLPYMEEFAQKVQTIIEENT